MAVLGGFLVFGVLGLVWVCYMVVWAGSLGFLGDLFCWFGVRCLSWSLPWICELVGLVLRGFSVGD